MPLDIKFRPGIFDGVIGQDVIVFILKSIIEQKKPASCYMFSGPSGVGKTTVARVFSKAILCEAPVGGNPCCSCRSCLLFQEDKHFGFNEIDAASYGGKDDMIKLRNDAAFLSVESKKILLIDECQDISSQGQDSLLKQMEQCPPHLIYLFCTTEPEKMKETLRKRCIHFQFSKVDSSIISNRLKQVCVSEGLVYDETALDLIASRSKGHVRDSLKLLEESSYLGDITVDAVQKISVDYSELIFTILFNLGQDLHKALDACKKLSSLTSNWVFYSELLSMTNDAVRVFYGYDDFVPQRKSLLAQLRDRHGATLLEFLNYLVSRDKYVDKIGLFSDVILLHYKFCSDSFKPQINVQNITPNNISGNIQPEQIQEPQKILEPKPSSKFTYAELSKLSIQERSKVLREQRSTTLVTEKEETPKIPNMWSLPKIEENQRGADSFDDEELSPLEFSKRLVGGRGGGV